MPLRSDDSDAIVARAEVLRELPTEARVRLVARSRLISAARGAIIFSPGDAPAVFVATRGRVVISARPNTQVELRLFDRRPGELFGELSLLLGRQMNEARAAGPSHVLRVPAEIVHTILRDHPRVTLALARLIADRMADAEARLGGSALRTVKDRLLRLLTQMARHSAVADSRGYLIRDPLTHNELAHMVGANRVTIIRALSALRREGKVISDRRRLIVPRRRSTAEDENDG